MPYRSSNVCAANAVDSQAGYESVFSLWGAVMGGANIVMHGAGWLEGGLRASYEKMVIDADLLQMVAAFLDPIIVDDASLAVEAIAEVGPGGHFFGVQHTQDRFRDAFFAPMVSDWRNFESWEEAGSPTALTTRPGWSASCWTPTAARPGPRGRRRSWTSTSTGGSPRAASRPTSDRTQESR